MHDEADFLLRKWDKNTAYKNLIKIWLHVFKEFETEKTTYSKVQTTKMDNLLYFADN